jgi:Uncharacterized protein conserved in bacteria (DUF2171)
MTEIKELMEVIGADGVHIGTVDKVEGNRIKLTKKDSGEGSHRKETRRGGGRQQGAAFRHRRCGCDDGRIELTQKPDLPRDPQALACLALAGGAFSPSRSLLPPAWNCSSAWFSSSLSAYDETATEMDWPVT